MTHATEQLVPDEADEPSPISDEITTDAAGPVEYRVVTRQRVDEVKRGGTLFLDPDEPRTARLLERGQIVRVNTTQED
jgi:hypothetical protein